MELNEDGLKNLYVAIFKQAKSDTLQKVKGLISDELSAICSDNKIIQNFFEKYNSEIENEVKKMVYEEAENYPKTQFETTQRNIIKLKNKFIRMYDAERNDQGVRN